MNINFDFIQIVRGIMNDYDSAKDIDTRITIGQQLDELIDKLSTKQIPQLVKIISK